MNPVVNPAIIYVINLMDSLRIALLVGTIVFVVLAIIFGVGYIDSKDDNSEEGKQLARDMFRLSKRSLVCLMITAFMLVFTPSKDTCIEMLVASYVTPNNIDAGVEKTKETVDYIIDKIKEVSE